MSIRRDIERRYGGRWRYVPHFRWDNEPEGKRTFGVSIVKHKDGTYWWFMPGTMPHQIDPPGPPITLEERRRIMQERQAKVVKWRAQGMSFGEIASRLIKLNPSSMIDVTSFDPRDCISAERARRIYRRAKGLV